MTKLTLTQRIERLEASLAKGTATDSIVKKVNAKLGAEKRMWAARQVTYERRITELLRELAQARSDAKMDREAKCQFSDSTGRELEAMRREIGAISIERNKLVNDVAACNAEIQRLVKENQRLQSDWNAAYDNDPDPPEYQE